MRYNFNRVVCSFALLLLLNALVGCQPPAEKPPANDTTPVSSTDNSNESSVPDVEVTVGNAHIEPVTEEAPVAELESSTPDPQAVAEPVETAPADESQTTEAPVVDTPPVEEVEEIEEHAAPTELAESGPDSSLSVQLPSSELTSGIPGTGVLTVEQVRNWLEQPDNHMPLNLVLPLGLAEGIGQLFIPADNSLTKAKIELGRQLYFDKRMSGDGTISCASCHHPDHGFARPDQFGIGINSQTGNRNSPVSYNRILSQAQFWDGRAATLEDQAVGPIANPIEHGTTHEDAVAAIAAIEVYRLQFESVFGPDSVNIDNIGKAIASFERIIVTGPSPNDYYKQMLPFLDFDEDDLAEIKEDTPDVYEKYETIKAAVAQHPMSDNAIRGRELFFSDKAACTACHVGANFTDEKYHNLGVGMDQDQPDPGRSQVTANEKETGAFKTPTLRNITLTAPYMHDGSQKTLEEVVEWYAKGGHANPHLSEKIKKLELSDQDKQDLVEYMKALTGEFPAVEQGRLP